jgi:hypothetical protein
VVGIDVTTAATVGIWRRSEYVFRTRIAELRLAVDAVELVRCSGLVSSVREVKDGGRDVASAVALSSRQR